MKKYFFIFTVLLFFSACEKPENYASISDEHIEQQASTAQQDIQAIVDNAVSKSEKRVGREEKKKKGQGVDVKGTVGGKNLGKEAKSKSRKVRKEQKKVKETVEVTKVTVTQAVNCEDHCKEKEEKKLDILFYINRRDSNCMSRFVKIAKKNGFLGHFSELDWQASFSYYSEETDLMSLEYRNGYPYHIKKGGFFESLFHSEYDYVLSEQEYSEQRRDRLFTTTLSMTKYLPMDGENGGLNDHTPDFKKYVNNPLAGLDHILTDKPHGFARSDSQVVVLLFGDQFPYYNSKDWKNFFDKHQNTSILSVSDRDANISNFLHVLEQEDHFGSLPVCSPAQVIQEVKAKLQ